MFAPSEFELIKNRATIVKCERRWTATCSGRSRCWQGAGAASVKGYPCPLPFGSMSTAPRSTTPNLRGAIGLTLLMAAVRREKVEILVCYKLDRLGRSLSRLVQLADEFATDRVALVGDLTPWQSALTGFCLRNTAQIPDEFELTQHSK